MKSFREYLIETLDNTRSHYTSDEGLYEILKDGQIIGFDQPSNKSDFNNSYPNDNHKVTRELCLIRKGDEAKISKIASSKIDNIKIMFDWDNIKKLRGIKKPYPIAEWNSTYYKYAISFIKNLERKNIITEEEGKKIFNIVKVYSRNRNKYQDMINNPSKAQRELKKEFPNKTKEDIEEIYFVITDSLAPYDIPAPGYREGEERLDLSDHTIPVSSEYIKIILGNDIIKYDVYDKEKEKIDNYIKSKRMPKELEKKFREKQAKELERIKTSLKKKEEVLKELLPLIEKYKKTDPSLFEYKDFK